MGESSRAATTVETLGGRYVLSGPPTSGAQASVVKAFDTKTTNIVAIKRLKAGANDERAREGLRREIEFLEALKHPHIVDLLAVERDDAGAWYLVLEWLPTTLEDVIEREGPMQWAQFWDRIGHPILEAITFAQKKDVAHRDIKPKNILVTEAGSPKLADYGIAKLIRRIDDWTPTSGHTFRFDHTPGYTPAEPDSPEYSMSRDCFAFAAVAVACLTGRYLDCDEDRSAGLQEAVLPGNIRALLERCLAKDAASRPRFASILLSQIENANAQNDRSSEGGQVRHLILSPRIVRYLERKLEIDGAREVEKFVLAELEEASAIEVNDDVSADRLGDHVDVLGVTWRFKATQSGRHGESLTLLTAMELGASLASELRDKGYRKKLVFTFDPPKDPERDGAQLKLLLVEAMEFQRDQAAERQARLQQRIFRVWRSYLRDRADLEAKRANAISYVARHVAGDKVVFITELAQNDDLVGQDRLVQLPKGRVTGRVSNVAFNQVTLVVNYGDPNRLPRRGDLAINTIAAQRALDHQSAALDAVLYDRTASPTLKAILLDPSSADPVVPVEGVEPTDKDFDDEKRSILASALGMQDILAIEGPPGTGKTKLITEIVVQWLQRHPDHRILLSSQTHIALDNVLERVAELDPSLDMIRIGRSDEPRISDFSKTLLLEHRVESWITEVKHASEADMRRWADANGVDRNAVAVGMKVERLKQVLKKAAEISAYIKEQEAERDDMEQSVDSGADGLDLGELEEETTQLDSEIGACRQALKALAITEADLRTELSCMGPYAAALATSSDAVELGEWADHVLSDEPTIQACRNRLELLEDWQLRVGRSPDFNAAMLASARIIAGTCVGIAGVKGMDDVVYDLCIIDEASKATATEMLIPMTRSKRWIVVGDPRQLPPFFETFEEQIKRDFPEEETRATILDRLLEDKTGLPQQCRVAIKNQYRMIKPIGDLVSDCFYNGKLNSPVPTHGLKLSAAVKKAVTWHSTQNLPGRFEKPEGSTYSNPTEVREIDSILKRLQFVAKAQKQQITVAVIAGYTAQVEALNDLVSRGVNDWPDLRVSCNSVDAFQGRQADICIYSVVRSNTQADLGFLREKPRLNVALSRGKSALIIVGDFVFCKGVKGKNPFKDVALYIEQRVDDCALEIL